ncbi:MAG: hypothetical protein AAFO69_18965, partial [Bacteroidota bacterium]
YNDISQLKTICIFCRQCFYLKEAAKMRSGFIIWLPEVDQKSLNALARDIYRAQIGEEDYSALAETTLDHIKKAKNSAKKILGTEDLIQLSDMIQQKKADPEFAEIMKNLRLFPHRRRIINEASLEFNMFPQIMAFWRSKAGPFGHDKSYYWLDMVANKEIDLEVKVASSEKSKKMSVADLGVKLLEDAAQFYSNLGEENYDIESEMKKNASVFRIAAQSLKKDPLEKPQPDSDQNFAQLAAQLLSDAARYFQTIASKNQPIKEQMETNSKIFMTVAKRLRIDPLADFD